MVIEFDFAWLEVQGRSVKGSTLTAHKVDRVVNAPKTEEGDGEISTNVKDRKIPITKPPAVTKDPDPKPPTESSTKALEEPSKGEANESEPPSGASPSEKEQATFDF